MMGLLSTGKNKKKISVKYLFLTIFVCISMVAWLGISDLKADENDPDNNPDEYEVRYQNAAQAQRTDNVARQGALQDPMINELIDQGHYRRSESGVSWESGDVDPANYTYASSRHGLGGYSA